MPSSRIDYVGLATGLGTIGLLIYGYNASQRPGKFFDLLNETCTEYILSGGQSGSPCQTSLNCQKTVQAMAKVGVNTGCTPTVGAGVSAPAGGAAAGTTLAAQTGVAASGCGGFTRALNQSELTTLCGGGPPFGQCSWVGKTVSDLFNGSINTWKAAGGQC